MANGNIIAELVNLINFEVNQNSVKQVNNTVNILKSGITHALGTIGIGLSIVGLNNIVESYQKMNREMSYLLQKSEDFGKTQSDILNAAEDARTSYQNMVSVVEALHTKNQKLFPVDEAIEFSTEVQKLLILSGRSETEAASLQRSLASIIGQSKITGSTLQSYASSAPILIDTVAESLGVARDELFRMADAGEVSAETIKRAITGMSDDIDEAFENMDYTLSDVLRSIRNQWGFFVSDLDETLKISATINRFLMQMVNRAKNGLNTLKTYVISLTNALGGTQNLLRALVGLVTAFTLVTRWEQIMKALKMVVSLFSAGSVAALGMVAIVSILFLLIDDFIAFMQGRDSVMGYAFQQAGIDAEEMRTKIENVWNNLVTFFGGVGSKLKEKLQPALDVISQWFKDTFGEDIFDDLGGGIGGAIEFFERLTSVLAEDEELQTNVANAITLVAQLYAGWLAFTTAGNIIKGIQDIAGALMSPIGVIMLVILALAFMRDKWDDVMGKVREILEGFGTWFRETFGIDISTQIEDICQAFQGIADFLEKLGEGDLLGAAKMIVDLFSTAFDSVKEVGVDCINVVIGWINTLIKGIVGAQNAFASISNSLFGTEFELWNAADMMLEEFGGGNMPPAKSFDEQAAELIENYHIAKEAAQTGLAQAYSQFGGPQASGGPAQTGSNEPSFADAFSAWYAENGASKVAVYDPEREMYYSPTYGYMTARAALAQGYVLQGNAQGNYVLPNNPHPVIVGDNRVEPEIISPVSKMIAAARTAFETSSLSSAIYALANARYASNATTYGPTNNSRNISQSVNINNTFNGERSIQQNAARIMDKSAGDITAELARALAYQF